MLAFRDALAACPLVAILRGVKPEECIGIGTALVDAGFTIIEVPLNSPDPYASIALLSREFGTRALVGAGTVIDPKQVSEVAQAGGRLIVMPHADSTVVIEAKALGLTTLPGFATPTEAFAMLAAGADGLKLFPAEASPPKVLKAIRAVLPRDVPILPVGSITVDFAKDCGFEHMESFLHVLNNHTGQTQSRKMKGQHVAVFRRKAK